MAFLLLSFSSYLIFLVPSFSSYLRFPPTVRFPRTIVFFVPSFSDLHNDPSLTQRKLASDAER